MTKIQQRFVLACAIVSGCIGGWFLANGIFLDAALIMTVSFICFHLVWRKQ